MSWNSAVDGDWSKADFTKAPWASGVMTLSHDEVLHVQTEVQKIIDAYVPKIGEPTTPDDNTYIVPKYNQLDWEKCINGDTYAVIKGYDPTVNTLGINAAGIIIPIETPIDETTSGDTPTEGQPVTEGAE